MSFEPLKSPVNYIKLAGQKSPGLAEVQGAASLREFAIRQPPFSTGARIVFKRRELARFAVRFTLLSQEDHDAWKAWRPAVDALPSVRREAKALEIWHPLLEELDIKAVVVLEVSQGDQVDDGVWVYTIKFLESRGLPKLTLAKVEGSKVTPKDPVDQVIENLAGQVQELSQ